MSTGHFYQIEKRGKDWKASKYVTYPSRKHPILSMEAPQKIRIHLNGGILKG